MHLKTLADECLDFRIVNKLKDAGFEVVSVLKDYQGISDREVLDLAKQQGAILITEDKDFGEWIFAHKEKNVSVIFLRYKAKETENIADALIKLLNKHDISLYGKFVVITVKKIRIREVF